MAHLSRLDAISSTDYLPRAFCSHSMMSAVIYLFIVSSVLSFFKGLAKLILHRGFIISFLKGRTVPMAVIGLKDFSQAHRFSLQSLKGFLAGVYWLA